MRRDERTRDSERKRVAIERREASGVEWRGEHERREQERREEEWREEERREQEWREEERRGVDWNKEERRGADRRQDGRDVLSSPLLIWLYLNGQFNR